MFALIALIAFWAVTIRLWKLDGPKIPLIFIVLWIMGLFGVSMLNVPGYFFLAFECILAVILLTIERVKSVI